LLSDVERVRHPLEIHFFHVQIVEHDVLYSFMVIVQRLAIFF
jgi:hypothetical protein